MSGYHYQISEASRLLAVEAHVLRYWEEELGMIIPRNEMGHRYYTEEHLRIFSQIKDMKERGYQLRAIRAILSGEEPPEPLITEIPLRKEQKNQGELRAEHLDSPGQASVIQPGQNSSPVKIPRTAPGTIPVPEPESVPVPGPLPPPEIPEPDRTPSKEKHTSSCGLFETDRGAGPGDGSVLQTERISIPEPAEAFSDEDRQKERMKQFQEVMTHIVAQAMLCNNSGLVKDISRSVEENLLMELKRMMNLSESRQEERFRKLDESMRAIQQGNRVRYETAAARSPGLFGRRKRRRGGRRI